MKKFILAGIVLTVFSTVGFSQTKKIAHRSHSGSNSTFTINGLDNFGETPEMEAARKKKEEEKRKLDSIAQKAAADSLAKLNHKKPVKKKDKNKKKSGSH